MKSRSLTVVMVAALIVLCRPKAFALLQFNNGGVHDIDYQIDTDVWVDYAAPGMQTTVNLLLGGFWPGEPVCLIEFEDYARFAKYWLDSGSGLPGDLDGDLNVDELDLRLFVERWLQECPYRWPLR